MENIKENNLSYNCNQKYKWIKIIKNLHTDIPYNSDIIKCEECKYYAILYFVHDENGDFYGPEKHNNCSGFYKYICLKNKAHKNNKIENEIDE